ncbi:cytochrome oxidase putative small subunit CydP [Glaciimonas soli]|uniref:Uncharacterized protein n=1 Tax=Glaciimonas soli TaxID=2590999 RepID=A0A843YJM8_9BURK|nr:cytochrome oxidase putative small subunit CydP [Glaciimonas soli]MQQ99988.1 hypothetical protein [Glaciimonas soli]
MTSFTLPKLRVPHIKHYKRLTRLPLALEIALILVVKIALLFVLWKLCFSQPQVKKMRMPTNLVEQHFLSPSSPAIKPASSTRPSVITSEASHDSN